MKAYPFCLSVIYFFQLDYIWMEPTCFVFILWAWTLRITLVFQSSSEILKDPIFSFRPDGLGVFVLGLHSVDITPNHLTYHLIRTSIDIFDIVFVVP